MRNEMIGTMVLLFVSTLVIGGASGEEYVTVFREDFDTPNPQMVLRQGGTGSFLFRDGFAFLNVTKTAAGSNSYARMENADPFGEIGYWPYVGMEVRLRCSDDNYLTSDVGGGWRIWILTEDWGWQENDAQFFSISPEAGEELAGFRVISSSTESLTDFNERITGVDMREWHTYTTLWKEDDVTFLVDEDVIATTDVSSKVPMHFLMIVWNLGAFDSAQRDYTLVELKHDVWIQVDHVRLFTTRQRFDEWSEEISALFPAANSKIEEAEGIGVNTTKAKDDYAQAEASWQKDGYFFETAKSYLQGILDSLNLVIDNYEEITGMFALASDLISQVEGKGLDRDALVMKGDMIKAEEEWAIYDVERTRTHLTSIKNKAADLGIPEPALLPILGLILLPALLRRR